jgi:hypothetical protein
MERGALTSASKSRYTVATYHCHITTFSRSKGQSAIAAAAYRSGQPLRDLREGNVRYPHRNSRDIEETFLIGWSLERESLWNTAESAEKRKDAQVAREVQVALPQEFTRDGRTEVAKEFATWVSSAYGVAVDVAIHRPRRMLAPKSEETFDNKNWHAHLLMTTRAVEGGSSLSPKKLEQFRKEQAEQTTIQIRQEWERLVNQRLRHIGAYQRVSSLKTINPQPKLTPGTAAYVRRQIAAEGTHRTVSEHIRAKSEAIDSNARQARSGIGETRTIGNDVSRSRGSVGDGRIVARINRASQHSRRIATGRPEVAPERINESLRKLGDRFRRRGGKLVRHIAEHNRNFKFLRRAAERVGDMCGSGGIDIEPSRGSIHKFANQ